MGRHLFVFFFVFYLSLSFMTGILVIQGVNGEPLWFLITLNFVTLILGLVVGGSWIYRERYARSLRARLRLYQMKRNRKRQGRFRAGWGRS